MRVAAVVSASHAGKDCARMSSKVYYSEEINGRTKDAHITASPKTMPFIENRLVLNAKNLHRQRGFANILAQLWASC